MARPRWLVPVAAGLLVLVGSLVPVPVSDGPVPSLVGVPVDKWLHAAGYAALIVSLVREYGLQRWQTVATAALVVVGYGGLIELLQGLVATRSLSAADAAANAVGAAVAGALRLVRDR